jgi:dienelactone hydrolase
MQSDTGIYRGILDEVLASQGATLSFLARDWPQIDSWRALARGKLLELLAFTPPAKPLAARTERRISHDGLEIEEVSWEVGYGPRCQAWVLKPQGASGTLPAVLALHDHGGFKYFGKEKIAEADHAFPLTAEFRDRSYGGVPWANALAKEGFLVLAHDAFAFGSRAVPVESLSPRYQEPFRNLKPGTPDYIRAYNEFAGDHETILAKSCFTAGTTWPGVFSYEDRRALDYLVTRPDVDARRIGCGGLSGGGLRTVMLAGTDDRIQAACAVGFMTTWQDFLHDRVFTHTWMLYVPHCARYLDFPDILSLHGPRPTMVLYDEDDPLYTLQGQRDADARLKQTFTRMGAEGKYAGRFYPGPHKFDRPMQRDAFAFFKNALGGG